MLPLHDAIDNMNADGIRSLLEAGADPNEPDPEIDGFRPLHLALDIECEDSCRRFDLGDLEAKPYSSITKQLLMAGANPYLTDAKGQSAIDIAHERNHEHALALFSGYVDPAGRSLDLD